MRPMLATLADRPWSGSEWIFELKWDGYRAIARIEDGNVDLRSRNFLLFNNDFPDIVSKLKKIKERVVLDGEIVAYDEKGMVTFSAIQERGQRPARSAYMIFDILHLNGKDLTLLPLMERKTILRKLLKKYPQLSESDYVDSEGEKFFDVVEKKDLEGIVAKKKDSPYLPGKRTAYWMKIKHHHTEEAVIAGFTKPRGSRKNFGALVLGIHKNDDFVFVGHTGTGFNEKTLTDLYAQMKPLATDVSPFKTKIPLNAPITWIKPVLVAQLKFTEWTKDNVMRHPVFVGLREDKNAESVTREGALNAKKIMKKERNKILTEEVEFTHKDKIFFPKSGYTKGDVIEYYRRIAPYMLPYLIDRPESLNRHPNGVDQPNFFQKNFPSKLPSFVKTQKIYSKSNDRDITYLLCQNKETLLYMANLGCIEINPWNSRIQKLDFPDYMIIDIDPDENTWADLVAVAKMVKSVLDEACMGAHLKTSGKTGLHIYVPLNARYHFDDVRNFSELVARVVHKRLPNITSIERSPAKRKNLIYLDYMQNRAAQNTASVYSLRPTEDATVSTPLLWSELTAKLDVKKFTIKTIFDRLDKKGDLWRPITESAIDLKEAMLCLGKSLEAAHHPRPSRS